MKLSELKAEVRKYQYMEDSKFIDAALACLISTRLNRSRPLWLILIGPSSSGKTQILRPLAMTDPKFIHSVDDLTENTFLSGAKAPKGGGAPMSLLQRIGSLGMIVISDLTGLFSKPSESRANILGQLRMIYDGEMTKLVGTSSSAITWKGHISILAGSTPSIYQHFEEFASFGERFIYYRLHDFNRLKATGVMLDRHDEKNMDETLSSLYGEYVKEVVKMAMAAEKERAPVSQELKDRVAEVADAVEMLRVAGSFDFKGEYLTQPPIPAMPMRTAGQLMTLAVGLAAMKKHEEGADAELGEEEYRIIDWCGYSLVNDQRRSALKVLAGLEAGRFLSTSRIGDLSGLPTHVVRMLMQTLAAVKVIERTGDDQGLSWRISDEKIKGLIRRMESITGDVVTVDRKTTAEESDEKETAIEMAFENWEKPGEVVGGV